MSSTPIYVLMQPKIRNSYWVTNILSGIENSLVKYKDKLCLLDSEMLSDLVYSLYKKPVLLVGSNADWIDGSINMLMAYEAVPILVNACMLPIHRSKCNGVVFELEEALEYCKEYLKNAGRTRIAFLGAHSHSVSDIAKCRAFGDVENTYTANTTIESCVDSFLEILPEKKYDGIICANDTVAIYLINCMRRLGYSLPDDCYVIGMGDSCLAANHSVSVSSVAFNYTQMGEEAVNLYRAVAKAPSPCHHTLSLPCTFIARESTGTNVSIGHPIILDWEKDDHSAYDDRYFSGEKVESILELEAIFQKCDQTDRQIIFGMLRKKSNEQIADEVYLTPRAVRYRINNFFERYTSMTQDEFFTALKNTLT